MASAMIMNRLPAAFNPSAFVSDDSQAEIDDMQKNPRWPKLDHIAQGEQVLRIRSAGGAGTAKYPAT
jgi:hypothetical protein